MERQRFEYDSNQRTNYSALTQITLTDTDIHWVVNAKHAENCVQTIREALGPSDKKYLFVLNPFGGQKKALKIYHKIVLPIIKIAGLEHLHELRETRYVNHASEIARDLDYTKYKVIASISGDGVFHEIVHGLLSRPDWELAKDLPIATIGGGTANGIGKNLDLEYQELATLAILKGKTCKFDVMAVIQNSKITYSHLSLTWGFVADVDIESEKWRAIGQIIDFRHYKGKLYMLPKENASDYVNVDANVTQMFHGPSCKYISINNDSYTTWPIQIETLNVPWIATDFIACPSTRIDNGFMDVVYTTEMNRSGALSCVIDTERGMHMTVDKVKHEKVVAFVLDPHGHQDSDSANLIEKDNILDLSGERIPYELVQVECLPQILNIIVPDWNDRERWEKKFYKDFPKANKLS
ncbi:hypothetical protein HK103_006675 [Boothiomyces macroporosus]|uniref:DAGKc domain-containing protein n=1 Tax=Boothiomyces macroporosus TaxID=261099 RepID=A0AAD5UDG5_9FUNG|nr:hypothetical protein HK103_006675 [Boothiomyces macroporosus]